MEVAERVFAKNARRKRDREIASPPSAKPPVAEGKRFDTIDKDWPDESAGS
jgi:hypothetical protein